MGGEKCGLGKTLMQLEGSPPRGRGKVLILALACASSGITPAWAGKSLLTIPKLTTRRDHPRVGGEKRRLTECAQWAEGSPPRGRGKVAVPARRSVSAGITPAWAGKSYMSLKPGLGDQDHPRVGGEKNAYYEMGQTKPGSPPRGRGKACKRSSQSRSMGITPAWAGKRLKRSHRSGIFISGPIPFHSVLHRPAGSGGSRAGRDGSPAGQPQNAGPA